MPTSLVGVNTIVPNRLVKKSIEAGLVEQLRGYENIKSEVNVSVNSRLDLLLTNGEEAKCFVEVKNCTLVEEGTAYFPDARRPCTKVANSSPSILYTFNDTRSA